MKRNHFLLAGLLAMLLPLGQVSAESTPAPVPTVTVPVMSVNVNQASAEEMADVLTGIGLKKAQAIVSYRQEHGSFASVQQLTEVKGIGPAIIHKNQSTIRLK